MKVPKCKNCEYHQYDHSGWSNQRGWHRCKLKPISTELMYASEARTSPKWCPKRRTSAS
jgi:hypothetical protein